MKTIDFQRSYCRFYIDLSIRTPISLSHRPPTQTNRTRILLEAHCRLTNLATRQATDYYLTAPCKTEQVGAGKGQLWIEPNADVIFLLSSDQQFAIHKSWARNDPGVMRYPIELGPQPERQAFMAAENFDDLRLDLCQHEAEVLESYEAVEAAILGARPLVSRISWREHGWEVTLAQPVKTINLCERDRLFQTDTGPLILPDLSPERQQRATLPIDCFDLAYSAWHASDWAEFIINVPTPLNDDLSVNHYSRSRHVADTHNHLLLLP